jgi:p24 family protein delta-1
MVSLVSRCADYQSAQHARLRVEWKTGAEAHDWESVAKKDNLNSIQTEMKKLTLTVHDIHLELQQIRRKEEQMRDINGKGCIFEK